MTKEPIIIDNINVSKCFHRGTNRIGNDIETYCKLFTGSCKGENCYYKQLQQKKEELDYLASFFDKSEVEIVNRLICYNRAVNAIRDIAASARADAGITDDYFKRNNCSQKQEQLKTLIQNFDKILKFCEVEKCN